jgi:hypothetical protein
MSYSSVPAFRPQIYSYQSRSRFRQYPRQVVTSIPGAGYAVKNLRWGEQAIDLGGLGTTAQTVTQAFDAVAQLTSNPDAYLRTKGPAIVAAADTYLLSPMSATIGRKSAPYVLKYVVPPLVILYGLSGLAAFFAYKAAKKSGAL